VLALVLTGQTLTVASLVGFISLGGIAVRNGILLIDHYLHLVKHEGQTWSQELIVRAEALPGVRSATLANYLPLALNRNSMSIYIEGQPVPRASEVPEIQNSTVWPKYLETMGIPLVDGREFTAMDGGPRCLHPVKVVATIRLAQAMAPSRNSRKRKLIVRLRYGERPSKNKRGISPRLLLRHRRSDGGIGSSCFHFQVCRIPSCSVQL
jgi:hypothetical protein